MTQILILNGPNLNLLGLREPEIYGSKTMSEVFGELKEKFTKCQLEYYQSNSEGAIIDKLHEVGFKYDGIILNAGAYSHTSIAIADAIKAIKCPVIELHISDINKREDYRKKSYLSVHCVYHIIGKGTPGYEEAVNYFMDDQVQQKT